MTQNDKEEQSFVLVNALQMYAVICCPVFA